MPEVGKLDSSCYWTSCLFWRGLARMTARFVDKTKVTATLSLAGACSSAGVTVLLSREFLQQLISMHQVPSRGGFAFISWFLLAVSSLVMFWLLGAV